MVEKPKAINSWGDRQGPLSVGCFLLELRIKTFINSEAAAAALW